jgi:hypothetical protein
MKDAKMRHPVLDPRQAADFEASIKALIPSYLPQWKPAVREPGWAVAQAFSQMAEEVAHRLNGVPEKLFLAYLERLGTEPGPANPAVAPVQFTLREKGAGSARIPQKTQLMSQSKALFETRSEFTAQKAALNACYLVEGGGRDAIADLYAPLLAGEPAPLHVTDSLQAHELYIRDDRLFRLRPGSRESLELFVPHLKKARWYYWGEDAQGVVRWIRFNQNNGGHYPLSPMNPIPLLPKHAGSVRRDNMHSLANWFAFAQDNGNSTTLRPKIPVPFLPKTVNGQEGYWIKAVVDSVGAPVRVNDFTIGLNAFSGIDAMFTNDVPIDLEATTFHPFGKEPKLQDCWYLASAEAFSKSGHTVRLDFEATKGHPLFVDAETATLSWEYWDGSAWQLLKITRLQKNRGVAFTVPDACAPLEYGSLESYWIRVRITAGGYAETTVNKAIVEVTEDTSTTPKTYTYDIKQHAISTEYTPPELILKSVTVQGEQNRFDGFVTYNNLTYGTSRKTPDPVFETLAESDDTLYLSFDAPFEGGLVSLFFALSMRQIKQARTMTWHYADENGGWQKLKIDDTTEALQKNGTITFLAPEDQGVRMLFGRQGCWLRIRLHTSEAAKTPHTPTGELPAADTPHRPCPDSERRFWVLPGSGDGVEQLLGIYTNTVWAEQLNSVAMELAGSSDASASQRFTLKNAPLFEPEVWVCEPLAPDDGSDYRYDDVRNGYWCAYTPAESLYDHGAGARVFAFNSQSGTVLFGDGGHGRIPPPGRDNIVVSYRYGGGSGANSGAGTIDKLVSTIGAVAAVGNPLPISGGVDPEPNAALIDRAPARVRHRDRGVSRSDIEVLALQASREIARVRLFLSLDAKGAYRSGGNTLVIVPHRDTPMPKPSFVLREQVETYLRARIAAVAAFDVIGPEYVQVSVHATLATAEPAFAGSIEEEAAELLAARLHPLTGKTDGSGWSFGEAFCLSDVILWLERIGYVEAVTALEVVLQSAQTRLVVTPSQNPAVTLPPYALIASGAHAITVEEV